MNIKRGASPRVIVFASGTKDSGGSGFEELVVKAREGKLRAEIVAVVSNHQNGGVFERATRLCVPFCFMPPPYTAEAYEKIVNEYRAEWNVLSGWLKLVAMREGAEEAGLDPAHTVNIHPGPLPRFGGPGMYGKRVSEAVYKAFHNGEITTTGPTMHFVTKKYDEGPVIFHVPITIDSHDTAEIITNKVAKVEHEYQWWVIDLVANREISWDGLSLNSLRFPPTYKFRI